MKRFEIYKMPVDFLDSNKYKTRPSIIIDVSTHKDFAKCYGIYSKKPWWDVYTEVYKQLYAIHKPSFAGLTIRNSYVNISNSFTILKDNFKEENLIGKLSTEGCVLLEEKIRLYKLDRQYNSQKTYLELLKELIKKIKTNKFSQDLENNQSNDIYKVGIDLLSDQKELDLLDQQQKNQDAFDNQEELDYPKPPKDQNSPSKGFSL